MKTKGRGPQELAMGLKSTLLLGSQRHGVWAPSLFGLNPKPPTAQTLLSPVAESELPESSALQQGPRDTPKKPSLVIMSTSGASC